MPANPQQPGSVVYLSFAGGLIACGFLIQAAWVGFAVLARSDPTNAISWGGSIGLFIAATAVYAERGSRWMTLTPTHRIFCNRYARLVVGAPFALFLPIVLLDTWLLFFRCGGRGCHTADSGMLIYAVVIGMVSFACLAGSWRYLREPIIDMQA